MDEFLQAADIGVATRPVILGPVSFLLLSKHIGSGSNLDLLPALCEVYAELLEAIAEAGAPRGSRSTNPCSPSTSTPEQRSGVHPTYGACAKLHRGSRLLVATYFAGLGDNLETALHLPVDALHLDAVADPDQVDVAVERAPDTLALSLGVVDGRNVWRTDLEATLTVWKTVRARWAPDRLMVGPSCSLLHLPVDLDLERLDRPRTADLAGVRGPASGEITSACPRAKRGPRGRRGRAGGLQRRRCGPGRIARVHDAAVGRRLAEHNPALEQRRFPYGVRRKAQAARLSLPVLPTTTIGSFPQTPARSGALRAQYRHGRYRHRRPTKRAAGLTSMVPLCSKKRWASTSWSTASPNATTWSSTSARCSTGSPRHQQRLGAELRLALCEATDHLRRRQPPADP